MRYKVTVTHQVGTPKYLVEFAEIAPGVRPCAVAEHTPLAALTTVLANRPYRVIELITEKDEIATFIVESGHPPLKILMGLEDVEPELAGKYQRGEISKDAMLVSLRESNAYISVGTGLIFDTEYFERFC